MLVVLLITLHVNNGVVGTEPRESVDVGIGIVAGEKTMIYPEYSFCSKILLKTGFDIVFAQVGVPVQI